MQNEKMKNKTITNWIDLYRMSPEEAEALTEDQKEQWNALQARQREREKNMCSELPLFLDRVRRLYEEATGKPFRELWESPVCQEKGNLVGEALRAIREVWRNADGSGAQGTEDVNPDSVDLQRGVEEWSLADMELIDSCLSYSLRWEYLLIHYNQQAMWGDKFGGMDPWDAYHGIFQECRSPVVNLRTMQYALLPFAKFRNLNEAPAYSEEAVAERIAKASCIEVSDKLDGSMIQMSRIGDERFLDGVLVATSGNLYPERSFQLKDVLAWLEAHGEYRKFLEEEASGCTVLFEWIDGEDAHVVRYDQKDWGLHLIGRRDMQTGKLWPVSKVAALARSRGLLTTELYEDSLAGILAKLDDYSAMEKEGYVMYIDGFLVKIKCTDYVGSVKLLRMGLNFRTALEQIVNGTLDDYVSKLHPAYQETLLKEVRRILDFQEKMQKKIDREFAKLPEGSKKEVMIYIDSRIQDPYGMIKACVRERYLGRELGVLARERGGSVQYIQEATLRKYEESGLLEE